MQELQRFPSVLSGNAATDDAQLRWRQIRLHLLLSRYANEWTIPRIREELVEFRQLRREGVIESYGTQALVDLTMSLERPRREDDVFLRIPLEPASQRRFRLSLLREFEERRSVVDAGGGTEDDRRAIALGQREGLSDHLRALFGRGWIQHGDLCEGSEATGILLRLAGNGAGIISHQDDQTALDAQIVQGHEGIRCHVQAHLLAGDQRPNTRERRSSGHLKGRFLVRGPLYVDPLRHPIPMQTRYGLYHLRGGRAGIACEQAAACLERRMRERFITHKEPFCHVPFHDRDRASWNQFCDRRDSTSPSALRPVP